MRCCEVKRKVTVVPAQLINLSDFFVTFVIKKADLNERLMRLIVINSRAFNVTN